MEYIRTIFVIIVQKMQQENEISFERRQVFAINNIIHVDF